MVAYNGCMRSSTQKWYRSFQIEKFFFRRSLYNSPWRRRLFIELGPQPITFALLQQLPWMDSWDVGKHAINQILIAIEGFIICYLLTSVLVEAQPVEKGKIENFLFRKYFCLTTACLGMISPHRLSFKFSNFI